MREARFGGAGRTSDMGNMVSLETTVLPGVPNPSAKRQLINNHYTVGDIYAARCTTTSGAQCTMAIFHGNLEDFAATQATWRRLKSTCLVGFEYPGYGWRTEEASTQAGILADIPKQVSYLKDKGRVIVVGRSLGTFAALHLAVALGPGRCAGVMLVSPMLTAIATKVPAPLYRALAFADYLDNESTAKLLSRNTPVFIVHGSADLVVPASNARALCKIMPHADYLELPGVHHNDVMNNETAWKAMIEKTDRWSREGAPLS
jgi:pimeloyl-ACP methyl ester carboxylesterase